MEKGAVVGPIGHVRPATAEDMAVIEEWLPKDRDIGTLAANWGLTKRMFTDGLVHVWEAAANREPVAYCWGTLNSSDSILEVHPEFRGHGVGRAMALFMLERSIRDGEPLLEIQIAPESAEPFWKAMGFETFWRDGACYGRRVLEFRRDLPVGVRAPVVITFFPEQAVWAVDVAPLARHKITGSLVDGRVFLNQTVAHFDLDQGRDLVVEVTLDGQRRYRGKAKYEGARVIGVRRCSNGFLINEINIDGM